MVGIELKVPYQPESRPSTVIRDALDAQWDTGGGNIPKPTIIDINNATSPLRADLINVGDHILVYQTNFIEQPIGTWVYGNQTTTVVLDIYTAVSRQRVYDLMQESRRIFHARMHLIPAYQRVQFKSFQEFTQEFVNIWGGRSEIELLNSSILLNVTP